MNNRGLRISFHLLTLLILLGASAVVPILNSIESLSIPTINADSVTWSNANPVTKPPARDLAEIAYDSARGVTVLFGGRVATYGFLNDTWEWNGIDWVQRTPTNSTTARSAHAMAYDSLRQRTVMFGGFDGGWPNTTWEWDGNNWSASAPVTSPSGRTAHAMAYDSARGVVVMFGGWGANAMGDTWEWNGSSWNERTPVVSPPPRQRHSMVYDINRERIVIFGGSSGSGRLNDLWEWDGSNWVDMTPVSSPSIRDDHGMAYDSTRQRTVMFGGRVGPLGDTWEWDGTSWLQIFPAASPSARIYPALAYDIDNQEVVLFSGADRTGRINDTWLYQYIPTPVIYVDIDIMPGSETNSINSNGHGAIPVAIFSDDTFDATMVDPSTIALDGQGVRIVGKSNMQAHIEDVNGDSIDDLIIQIEDVDGTYQIGDAIAILTGATFDGILIEGSDSIRIVP